MSRPSRVEYPRAWHRVLNRGRGKEKIFLKAGDRQLFFKLIEEFSRLWRLKTN